MFVYMHAFCPYCHQETLIEHDRCSRCGSILQRIPLPPGIFVGVGDKYRIEAVLGMGSFGITYVVSNMEDGKHYALKELFPADSVKRHENQRRVIAVNSQSFSQHKELFIKEVSLLLGLDPHPYMAKVWEAFEQHGTVYYVMDFILGHTLEQLIQKHPQGLPVPRAIRYMRQIANVLAFIHERGLLHRDIKPENIIIDRETDRAKLIDFGAARIVSMEKTITLTTVLTPTYAAPEQFRPRGRFGPTLDIYALGATFYHVLSGNRPESSLTRLVALHNQTEDPLPRLRTLRPDIPAELERIIHECMKVEVSQRPQGAAQLFERLRVLEEKLHSVSQPKSNASSSSESSDDLLLWGAGALGALGAFWLGRKLFQKKKSQNPSPPQKRNK